MVGRRLDGTAVFGVAEIAQAAGYSTNLGKRVPNSRGQKRGDLEIKRKATNIVQTIYIPTTRLSCL